MHSERRRKCSDEHRPESLIMAVSLLLCLSDAHANSADSPLRERGTPANGIERLTLPAGVSASVSHRLGYRDVRNQFYSSHAWTSGVLQAPDHRWNEVTHHLKADLPPQGSSLRFANRDTTQLDSGLTVGITERPNLLAGESGKVDNRGTGKRIALKAGAGALGGIASGLILGSVFADAASQEGGDDFSGLAASVGGLLIGYTAGTAAGVALVDPHDRFISALIGSSMGMWSGVKAVDLTEGWSLLVCPLVGAILSSEIWRDSSGDSRLSVGLVSDPRGRLSAVSTLRF